MRFALIAFSAAVLAAVAGCSDPAPVVPDAAFLVTTTQPAVIDPTQPSCPIMGHTTVVGDVSDTQKKTTLEDGMQGAIVGCTVSGSKTFNVNAQIAVDANTLAISIGSISSEASQASPATGSLTFADAKTVNSYGGSCNYFFAEGTPEAVESGKIWVSFTCDSLKSGPNACPVSAGVALFENCLME